MMNPSILLILLLLSSVKISFSVPVEDNLVTLVDYCLENPKILTPNAFFGINFADALISGNLSDPKAVILKQKIQILRENFKDFLRNTGIYVFDFVINPKFWRENLQFSKEKLHSESLNVSIDAFNVLLNIGSPSEEESDECLRDVSGKFCHVSKKCWEIMSSGIAFGYHQTHKLLFNMVLSRERNCNIPHKATQKIIHKLCKRIFSEVLTISHQGFPDYLQDLVMEQIFLCSYSGFGDFLKAEWIREIISWQDKSGCFVFKRITEDQSQCSDHMTGVGAAILALILRYFEEENAFELLS